MIQYIDKNKVEEILRNLWKEDNGYNGMYRIMYNKALQEVQCELDSLEVKDVEEEAVSNDLEDYAKKESESFAEREYEIDYIDRNALAKGYYWGVKAGAQWQKQKNTIEVKEVDLQKEIDEVIHNYKVDNHRHTSICSVDIKWIAEHFFEIDTEVFFRKGYI